MTDAASPFAQVMEDPHVGNGRSTPRVLPADSDLDCGREEGRRDDHGTVAWRIFPASSTPVEPNTGGFVRSVIIWRQIGQLTTRFPGLLEHADEQCGKQCDIGQKGQETKRQPKRDNDNDNDTLREVPHQSNEGLALQARVSGPWPLKKESVLPGKLAHWQGVQVQIVMDRV